MPIEAKTHYTPLDKVYVMYCELGEWKIVSNSDGSPAGIPLKDVQTFLSLHGKSNVVVAQNVPVSLEGKLAVFSDGKWSPIE